MSYARVLTAHSLRRNCPKLLQQLATKAWIKPHKGKSNKQLHYTYNPIDFTSFNNRVLQVKLLTLHAPQWDNSNKYDINGNANLQAF